MAPRQLEGSLGSGPGTEQVPVLAPVTVIIKSLMVPSVRKVGRGLGREM